MKMDKYLTAAVAGHADHGTAGLVRCLTEVDAGALKDGKICTVSAETSFSPFQLPSGVRIALVDMPNPGDLSSRAPVTLNSVDLAVLVVAADDGVMTQTGDALEALNRLNPRGGLAVITGADRVDRETIELAGIEIRELCAGSCLEGKPIIPFSESDRRGLDQILATLEEQSDRIAGSRHSSSSHYKALKRHVIDSIREILVHNVFQFSVSACELTSRIEPTPDDALLQRILGELCAEEKLIPTDNGYRMPSLSVKLPSNLAKLAEQMLEYARSRRYVTFTARSFCQLHWKQFNVGEIQGLLEHLRKKNKLVLLNDGRYLTSEAMEEIKEKVTDLISRKGSLSIQDSRQIFGYGRNRAIPVLDYLDSIGVTRRIDDLRTL